MSETPKPTEKPQEKIPEKTLNPDGTAHTISLEERMLKAVQDSEDRKMEYLPKALDERDKRIDDKIAKVIEERDIALDKALRKGLGSDLDPVIHMSDLPSLFRKYQLENTTEASKKTPAPLEKAGPEGTATPEHPIDKLLKEYGMTPQGGKK